MSEKMNPPARVLLTKIGLDGHDRGSRIIAAFLRDAGMDVIYTPPWQPIETVVATVGQEDVDIVGISTLATDHLIIPDLMQALRDADHEHVRVMVGGIVPDAEHQMLYDAGVSRVFGPGASREDVVACANELAVAARDEKLAELGV